MASADELAALRRVTNLDADDTTYTDELLGAIMDAQGSISAAASQIWRERAASMAVLVDTTESGSSRKLSDLAKNALTMADNLAGVTAVEQGARRSYTVGVERQ